MHRRSHYAGPELSASSGNDIGSCERRVGRANTFTSAYMSGVAARDLAATWKPTVQTLPTSHNKHTTNSQTELFVTSFVYTHITAALCLYSVNCSKRDQRSQQDLTYKRPFTHFITHRSLKTMSTLYTFDVRFKIKITGKAQRYCRTVYVEIKTRVFIEDKLLVYKTKSRLSTRYCGEVDSNCLNCRSFVIFNE